MSSTVANGAVGAGEAEVKVRTYRKGRRVWVVDIGTNGLYEVKVGTVKATSDDRIYVEVARVLGEPGDTTTIVHEFRLGGVFDSEKAALRSAIDRCGDQVSRWSNRQLYLIEQLLQLGAK